MLVPRSSGNVIVSDLLASIPRCLLLVAKKIYNMILPVSMPLINVIALLLEKVGTLSPTALCLFQVRLNVPVRIGKQRRIEAIVE